MRTDPISEARREFEGWVWPGTVEMRTMTDAELDAAKDTAFAHLRAAILAADPRRAALETALRELLAEDGSLDGYPGWIAYNDYGAHCTYCDAACENGYDAEAVKAVAHGMACPIPAALKALEETAVEETRS